MSKLRKILFAVAAFGGAVTAVGAGTFASFSATTTNAASFATGTLILSDKAPTTDCRSSDTSIATNSQACEAIFSTLTGQKPGQSGTVNITLENAGTINDAVLSMYSSGSCTPSAVGTPSGGSDPCGLVEIYVQKWSGAHTGTPTCLYGTDTGSNGTCDFDSGSPKTLSQFVTDHTNNTELLALDSDADGGGADKTYITVGVKLPTSAGNGYQNMKADFGLTFSLVQS